MILVASVERVGVVVVGVGPDVVGADVVGAAVVGADVVGAAVVGADVVGVGVGEDVVGVGVGVVVGITLQLGTLAPVLQQRWAEAPGAPKMAPTHWVWP
jgi:hypothetical protein